ncbi:MAG: hypothetical protein C0467_32115 [Planctomycetaceae bacterium]|nr:hypothetical protein [Planctomycetaceae bacterium]
MPDEGDPRLERVRRALDQFLDRLAQAVARELVTSSPPSAPPAGKLRIAPDCSRTPDRNDK